MTLLARVDPLECSGHGDCAEIAPDVFHVDGVATVVGTGPDELLSEAAEACPAVAISIVETETGETLFP
jgi:ferredoxin